MAQQWECWIDGSIRTEGSTPPNEKIGANAPVTSQPNWVVLLPLASKGSRAKAQPPVVFFRHQHNPVLTAHDDVIAIAHHHASTQNWAPTPTCTHVISDGLLMATTPMDSRYNQREQGLILTGLLEERYTFRGTVPALCHTPVQRGSLTYTALPQHHVAQWPTHLNTSLGPAPTHVVSEGLLLLHRLQTFNPEDFDTLVLVQAASLLVLHRPKNQGWQHHHFQILPVASSLKAFDASLADSLDNIATTPSPAITVLSLHPQFTTQDVGRILQAHLPQSTCRPWVPQPQSDTTSGIRAYELRQWVQTLRSEATNTPAALPAHTLFTQQDARGSTHLFNLLLSTQATWAWGIILAVLCIFSWVLELRIDHLQAALHQSTLRQSTTDCLAARHQNDALTLHTHLLMARMAATNQSPNLLGFTLTASPSQSSTTPTTTAKVLSQSGDVASCQRLHQQLQLSGQGQLIIDPLPTTPPYCSFTFTAGPHTTPTGLTTATSASPTQEGVAQ